MNRKEELKQEVANHQHAIAHEIERYKEKGKKIGMAALITGGAFLLTYTIVRGISSGKKSRDIEETPYEGQVVYQKPPAPQKSGFGKKVGGIIMTELAILLVGMLKKQITNYINKLDISHDDEVNE